MKNIIKSFYRNKVVSFTVTSVGLFLLWVALTCLYIITFDTSLSVLSDTHGRESFNKLTYSKLYAKDAVSGTFKATEDNLGIVSIKFQTFIRPPFKDEDKILFRIREKGARDWYYESVYRDGLIYDLPVFPFGFPKITNSKNKEYYFEIESLNGNWSNSIAISRNGQILFSKYQFSKARLLHDKKELIIFALKKFLSAIYTTDVRFSSIIYLLPLVFYIIWISPFRRFVYGEILKSIGKSIKKHKDNKIIMVLVPVFKVIKNILIYNIDWIVVCIVLLDIFIVQVNNDIVYVVTVAVWIATLRAYKLSNKLTFLFGLSLLVLSPILLTMREQSLSEKATVWAYMFIIAGIIYGIFFEKDHTT